MVSRVEAPGPYSVGWVEVCAIFSGDQAVSCVGLVSPENSEFSSHSEILSYWTQIFGMTIALDLDDLSLNPGRLNTHMTLGK